MCNSNEQHDAEIDSARVTVEEDIAKNSEDILQCFNGLSEQERGYVSEILTTSGFHSETLEILQKDHAQQSATIEQHAIDTFRQKYMDYEATGSTPIKSELDIPSKATIESLRTMPMEVLQEEFRENHSDESLQIYM
ncbi:kinesin-related protein [Forsythia ovata]|uniref:Kinesin-related protein n=1 Tax=Forsythia ovata TaxID=205694 RepID=A0ABD1SQQ0_9LAMI